MRENLSKVHEIEKNFCVLLLSLPPRGGWIEMTICDNLPAKMKSPSPRGEGGLKLVRGAFLPLKF